MWSTLTSTSGSSPETQSIFWFTMCDLQAIFRADKDHIKTSLDQFFQAVGSSYLPVLSLIELVRRSGRRCTISGTSESQFPPILQVIYRNRADFLPRVYYRHGHFGMPPSSLSFPGYPRVSFPAKQPARSGPRNTAPSSPVSRRPSPSTRPPCNSSLRRAPPSRSPT